MIGEQTLEGRRENLSQANIFNRWSCQGIWLDMFKALSGRAELFGTVFDGQFPRQSAPLGCRQVRHSRERTNSQTGV